MLFVLFMISSIYMPMAYGSRKQFCNLDNECLTKAIRERVYKQFVEGLPGVAPSDPLSLETIEADQPNVKYKLTSPTLTGMKNCDFLKLKLAPKENVVTYELMCPHLNVDSKYEVSGLIDAVQLEGSGHSKITYGNYFVNITGNYERITAEDGKLHFHIIDFDVKLDLQGEATSEYQGLVVSDVDKVAEYSKKLEEWTRETVMQTFLNKYVHNLQDFQKTLPLEKLHFVQV